MYTAYAEHVCQSCSQYSEQYEQLTKSDVSTQYLLTDSTIRMMKYQEKDNPRNSNWSMMKLYLRKHAITQALERWGTLAQLEIEKEKRNLEKLDKQTEAVSSLFCRVEGNSPLLTDAPPPMKKTEKVTKSKRRKLNMAAIVANMQGK